MPNMPGHGFLNCYCEKGELFRKALANAKPSPCRHNLLAAIRP